jgi:hypothetical protein
VAADDHHLEAGLVGNRLQAGRAHLAGRADGEPVAATTKVSPRWHAGAEVGHQIAERSRLPALVERVEAFRHAVGGRRDLIGVDRVELLLLSEDLQIPEDERLAANDRPSTSHPRPRSRTPAWRSSRWVTTRFQPGRHDLVIEYRF